MTRTRQFGVNEVRFVESDPQLIACIDSKNGGGQYRLRLLRAMQLPQLAHVLEAWLSFRDRRFEANRHDDDGSRDGR
jgi:hypothetical protein